MILLIHAYEFQVLDVSFRNIITIVSLRVEVSLSIIAITIGEQESNIGHEEKKY